MCWVPPRTACCAAMPASASSSAVAAWLRASRDAARRSLEQPRYRYGRCRRRVASMTAKSPTTRLGGGQERELRPPRQPLDARLLTAGGGTVDHRDRQRKLDGQPAGGVAARGTGAVARKPALEIDRPPGVEQAIAAAQQIHPGLGHAPT